MVDIYLYIPKDARETMIWSNDSWFDEEVPNVITVNQEIQRLMNTIDGSEFIGRWSMLTKYGDVLGIKYLSTGCKTAINCYLFRERLVNASECGANALKEILHMAGAQIFTVGLPGAAEDFSGEFRLHRSENRVKEYQSYYAMCDGSEESDDSEIDWQEE